MKEKIETALASLETKMQSQSHLSQDSYDSVMEDVDFLMKCFSALNEEDREFLGAAKFAIKAQMRWD
jgi:hypothetical protein